MKPKFPHDLSDLRDLTRPTVLFCGAGLSIGVVPGPASLYQDCCAQVENELALSGEIDHGKFATIPETVRLYAWADAILHALAQRGDSLPKLKLARALRLLDDPRWWGQAEIEFRGNSPRHRVIARFAKEGLWHSIWSFNWDCILENALEQVGLANERPAFATPWEKDHYAIHVHSDYFPGTSHPHGLVVHKPHGCVRALRVAAAAQANGDSGRADSLSYRLMIGQQELENRDTVTRAKKEDARFSHQLGSDVPARLNLIVGWSLGEQTLMKQLERCVAYPETSIAVLDPCLSENHKQLCIAAKCDEARTHFFLRKDDCPNRDDIFLWQQALFTLDRLEQQNGGIALVDLNGKGWRTAAEECPRDSFFCSWSDEFLPVWTRLCWSAGLVKATKMPSHRIDLERRDEHIPLSYDHVLRPDLQAAVAILGMIPGLGCGINAQDYPGGLLIEATQTLVVPLPCWDELNTLRALTPLVDALRARLGYVQRLAVWPVDRGKISSDVERSQRLVERLAALMPIPGFAIPGNICIIQSICEGSHASD